MRLRTQLLAAGAILALGAGTLWLAASSAEADVRFVEQVTADPASHTRGTYTLMGIPEPAQVPVTGPNGTQLVPNPEFRNLTRTTSVWQRAGQVYYSTHTLGVRGDAFGTLWWFRNETRRSPTDQAPAFPVVTAEWHLGAAGQVFPVAAFTDPEHQRVWAWYDRGTDSPLQPKPSQFTGRLLSILPDGTPLPAGALVYKVEQYTAGCSSKFLPPELQARYGNETASP
ncbi:MAG TPA: hypothetical protein VM286_01265 [Candidatus Thermoplasmatota archaeon]|nr:hypothetical protein [Candidatus Thermoplasmatota archaeon]